MGSSHNNPEICFLSFVIDIFSKYAWVISLEDHLTEANTKAFQKTVDDSGHKPNDIWVAIYGMVKVRSFITDQLNQSQKIKILR